MKVIAIDMDKTSTKYPEKVNKLFEDPDNFIVIHTARSESLRDRTVSELSSNHIKYHALVMEKLRADVYIDDKNSGGLNWKV